MRAAQVLQVDQAAGARKLPVVLLDYGPPRSSAVHKRLLKGVLGTAQTDAYSGCHQAACMLPVPTGWPRREALLCSTLKFMLTTTVSLISAKLRFPLV